MTAGVLGFVVFACVCCGSAVAVSAGHTLLAAERLARIRAMVAALHLTGGQKVRIRSILHSEEVHAAPTVLEMERNHTELIEATENGYDPSRVQPVADREGRLVSKLIVDGVRTKARVFDVLSTNQRDKVNADEHEVSEFVASSDFVQSIDSLVH